MKRLICLALVCILVMGNAVVCQGAELTSQAGYNENVAMPRERASFEFAIQANSARILSDTLMLAAGDTVQIRMTCSNDNAKLTVGLVDSNGTLYAQDTEGSVIVVVIEITKQDDYRLYIKNRMGTAVTVSGIVRY